MSLHRNNGAGGSTGVVVANGDTGSGDTFTVGSDTSGAFTYLGTEGYAVAPTSNLAYRGWNGLGGTTCAGAFEVTPVSWPAANQRVMAVLDNSAALMFCLNFTTAGKITVINSASGGVHTLSTVINTGTRPRIEWQATTGATTGQVSVQIFTNKTDTTPVESYTSSASVTMTSGTIDAVRFGECTSGTMSLKFYNLAFRDSSLSPVGPAPGVGNDGVFPGAVGTATAHGVGGIFEGETQVVTGSAATATAAGIPGTFSGGTGSVFVGATATASAAAIPGLFSGGGGTAAARINLCANPSYELDLTGVTPGPGIPPPSAALPGLGVTGGTAVNSLTFFYGPGVTTSGLLLVAVSIAPGDTTQQAIGSVTFGGVALTFVAADAGTGAAATGRRVELWRLLNPSSTAANIVITLAASHTGNMAASAVTFDGVNQTTPLGTAVTFNTSTIQTVASVNVDSTGVNDLIFASAGTRSTVAPVPGAAQTAWYTNLSGTNNYQANSLASDTGTTVTMTETIGTADYMAMIGVAIHGLTTTLTSPTIAQNRTYYHASSGSLVSCQVSWQGVGLVDGHVDETFTTSIGQTYTVAKWVYVPSGSCPVIIQVIGVGLHGGWSEASSAFDLWHPISRTFVATATSHTVRLYAAGPQSPGMTCYMDDTLFEQSPAALPYFDGGSADPGAFWYGDPDESTSGLVAWDPTPAAPLIVLEFDARRPMPGEFQLDSSALDGTDVMTDRPRWVTVNNGLRQGSIVRGKTDPNSQIQVGQATLVFDNKSGDFDPENMLSQYNLIPGQPAMRKGMLCRISALMPTGGQYAPTPLFVGRLESVVPDKGWDLSATLTFVDDLAVAAATGLPSYQQGIRGGDTTGVRAAWLASMLPGLFGDVVVSPRLQRTLLPTSGGGNVLVELEATVAAEAGRVYVDRAGNLQIQAHADDLVTSGNTLMVTDQQHPSNFIEYDAVTTPSGAMQLITQCALDRFTTGGDATYPTVYGGDSALQDQFGLTSLPLTAALANDADATDLATYEGTRRARPLSLIDGAVVSLIGQPNAAALLTADLGDTLAGQRSVAYDTGNQVTTLGLLIEGLRWDFSPSSFALTAIHGPTDSGALYGGAGVFLLDSSSLDGPDVLASFS